MGWPLGHPIALFLYHLAAQVAGDVGNVYPATVALKDELGELDAPLLLHLHDEAEQTVVISLVARDDVGRAAEDVVAILGAAHQGVELLAAVAAAHRDRLSPRFADGIEELLDEDVQQVVCTLGWAVVDALAQRCGAAC